MLCNQPADCDVTNVDDRGVRIEGILPRGVTQLRGKWTVKSLNLARFQKQFHSQEIIRLYRNYYIIHIWSICIR